MVDDLELSAKLASRICHDLISPVGAISNGVELLAMSGMQESPELGLIGESVRNAEAKIRFFRIAFGRAEAGQSVGENEILNCLRDYYDSGRIKTTWQNPSSVPRPELRAIFLALNCLETELAFGGEITISRNESTCTLTAVATRLRGESAAWEALASGDYSNLNSALLQFSLLPMALKGIDRVASVSRSETEVTLSF